MAMRKWNDTKEEKKIGGISTKHQSAKKERRIPHGSKATTTLERNGEEYQRL